MPYQNRVTPWSEIVSHPGRGILMGNRGRLHDSEQRLVKDRGWTTKAWISCELVHGNWHREIMQPGKYTELFFLDEAVALSAGHRPCAMCRNRDYKSFLASTGLRSAGEIDQILHDQRFELHWRGLRVVQLLGGLPDGVMVELGGHTGLIFGKRFWPFDVGRYGEPLVLGESGVVLTPPLVVSALENGYHPRIHPSILALAE